jgi:molecular chaperone DnaK
MSSPITVGIDLGTTNSAIAYHDGVTPRIIDVTTGGALLPSAVTIVGKDVYIGRPALDEGRRNPEFAFKAFKSLMGRRWSDAENAGWQTVEAEDGSIALRGPDHNYTPQELSAAVIQRLLDAAQDRLGARPTRAVITVPHDFGDRARRATEEAGRLAGLEAVFILSEPTAAAIAYGAAASDKYAMLAVYDWGGGTFDLTVVQAGGAAGGKRIEVKGNSGNRDLGGEDIDRVLADFVVQQFLSETGIDLGTRETTMARILDEAERVKIALSDQERVRFEVPRVDAVDGQKHIQMDITRERLESLSKDLIDSTFRITARALEHAGLKRADIDSVLLVGGQTAMPMVRERAAQFFGKRPRAEINPYEVVAMGAATQGAILDSRLAIKVSDVLSHSIRVETRDRQLATVVPKGTRLPVEKSVVLTTLSDDQRRLSVNLHEGDEMTFDDNERLLSSFVEHGEAAPAGGPSRNLTVRVDVGNLVSASVDGVEMKRG